MGWSRELFQKNLEYLVKVINEMTNMLISFKPQWGNVIFVQFWGGVEIFVIYSTNYNLSQSKLIYLNQYISIIINTFRILTKIN